MKIKRVYISAFGGLKDRIIEFEDGFNIIYGDNENGKSTVMAFIKMMFYGNEGRQSSISKNIRKKYEPWDGSRMAGSVDFEHSNKNYRLEREFGASNSSDKLTLCDLDFGTRQAVSADIGTKFFGLSSAAFDRSVFIGQFGYCESNASAEGEINSKLSNIATTGDESISYTEVNTRLEKARLKLMSKSGRAGEYDKNVKLLSELKEKLEKSEAAQQRYQLLKSEIAALKSEAELLQKNAHALKIKVNNEQNVKNAAKLREMLDLKAQLDEVNETLRMTDGTLADEPFVRSILFCIAKIDGYNEKIASKISEAQTLKQSIDLALNPTEDVTPERAKQLSDEINSLTLEKDQVTAKCTALEKEYDELLKEVTTAETQKNPVNLPLIITAGIMLVLSVALFLSRIAVPGIITSVITVTSAAAAFIFRPLDKKRAQALKTQLSEIKNTCADLKIYESELLKKLAVLESRLETINSAIGSNSAILERQKALLLECNQVIESENIKLTNETKTLLTQFARYKKAKNIEDIKNELDSITEKALNQKEIKQRLNYIARDVGNISYEEARKKLEEIGDSSNTETDFDALKQQYENTLSEITDKKTLIATLNAELGSCLSGVGNPDDLKREIHSLTERVTSQSEFCKAAEIAGMVLTESFSEVRRSYGSVLEKKAGEIFQGLTGNRYKSMSISKSFEINVEQNGVFGGKELDYLSSGTTDQAYLSLRLALSELISENGEPLPIMLDDALTQYDDGRIKAALEFLNQYSQNSQIIMFTCHSSILDASKAIGANQILM